MNNETDFWAQRHTAAFQVEQQARQAEARAASAEKMAARQEAARQRAAELAQKKEERTAFVQAAQARREAFARGEMPATPASTLPRLTHMRMAERAAQAEAEKQRELAARGGMSDFVLRNLPRNDPKAVAYRAALINPPALEGNDHAS